MLLLVPGCVVCFACFVTVGSSQENLTNTDGNITSQSRSVANIIGAEDISYLAVLSKTLNLTGFTQSTHITNRTDATKLPKLKKRKGIKKRRRRRRKNIQGSPVTTTTEQTFEKNKRKQTAGAQTKRRRRRKQKRKQKVANNPNILEITTAKGVLKNHSNFDFTENEIVQALNKNPEQRIRLLRKKEKKIKSKFYSNNSSSDLFVHGGEHNSVLPPINDEVLYRNESTTKIVKKSSNRCKIKNGGCSQICNLEGSQKCSCLKGFVLNEDGKTCEDIDECKVNNGLCQTHCQNSLGSYRCYCLEGFRLAYDMKSCIDINECRLRNGHGPCQDMCRNTVGSYSCSCENLKGTKLSTDGRTCEDLDECLQDNGGCSHKCINVFGKVYCSCPEGWELSSDWKTCQDVNECDEDNLPNFCNHTCINTEGSYKCLESNYMLSDQSLNVVCKPLQLPHRGFINCSRENFFTFYTRSGRKRFTNSVGTNCKLVCPSGYKTVGEYDITCGTNGKWIGNRSAKCIRSVAPFLRCPPNQTVTLKEESDELVVHFPPPVTNVHWKFVKSSPLWAKNLTGTLTEGRHEIMFIVKDPKSKLFSSCIFYVNVEPYNE